VNLFWCGGVVSADYVLKVLKKLWELHKQGLDINTRVDNDVFISDYERGIEITYFARSHGPPYKWRVRFDVRRPRVSEGLVYSLGDVFPYVDVLVSEGVYELATWFHGLVSKCFDMVYKPGKDSGYVDKAVRVGFARISAYCDPAGSWIVLGIGRKFLVYGGNTVAYTDISVDDFRKAVRKVMEWWRGGGKEEVEGFVMKKVRDIGLFILFP